jgi:hypothetical protein
MKTCALCGLTPERRADRAHGLPLFEHKVEEVERIATRAS